MNYKKMVGNALNFFVIRSDYIYTDISKHVYQISGVILGPFSIRLLDAALPNFPEKSMPFSSKIVIFHEFLAKKCVNVALFFILLDTALNF